MEQNTTQYRLPELNINEPDNVIVQVLNKWKSIGGNYQKDSIQKREENLCWYVGNADIDDVEEGKSKVVDNRIFVSVESIIPSVTAQPPVPVVFNKRTSQKKKEGEELERLTQKILTHSYDKIWMQKKMEIELRQWYIYLNGFLKVGIKDWKIFTEPVLPERILVNKYNTELCDWVWEIIVDFTATDLIQKFPDKKAEIKSIAWKDLWTRLEIIDWRTDEYHIVQLKDIILKKEENQLFDYDDTMVTYDETWKEIQWDFTKNYFNAPKIPYVPLGVYTIGRQFRDEVNTLEEAIPLQKELNERLRQIHNNATITGDPHLIARGMEKRVVADMNRDKTTGDVLWVQLDQDLDYMNPWQLASYIPDTLNDLRNEIDNVFWTQATFRGEKTTQETATWREILRQASEERQAPLARALESQLKEVYRRWMQLVTVFYDVDDLTDILWEEDAKKFVKLRKNNPADWIEIEVQAWSTIPKDKISIRAQAIELAQLGKISDIDLYEALDMEEPAEMVDRLQKQAAVIQKKQQEVLQQEEQGRVAAQQGPQQMQQVMEQISQLQ